VVGKQPIKEAMSTVRKFAVFLYGKIKLASQCCLVVEVQAARSEILRANQK